MTTPTPEAIEAAARAMSEAWRDMHTNEALGYQRMLSTAALTAAAPFIVSAKSAEGVWTMTDAEFQRSRTQAKVDVLREAAFDLPGGLSRKGFYHWLRARAATTESEATN